MKTWFRKPQLALHIITQNRRDLLIPTVIKCQRYYDVIRCCDGGSTDGTKEAILSLGPDVKYYYREWDDHFNKQDNELLSCCKSGDWVMIIDDDECPSTPLLEQLRALISHADSLDYNMISMPSFEIRDGNPPEDMYEFIASVRAGRQVFRKNWFFKFDPSVQSFGKTHRAVESVHRWRIFHQPYPYIHTKSTIDYMVRDCVYAFANPIGQGHTQQEADLMYKSMPAFNTSREVVPWLVGDDVTPEFETFAQEAQGITGRPIGSWWQAYNFLKWGKLYPSPAYDKVAKEYDIP